MNKKSNSKGEKWIRFYISKSTLTVFMESGIFFNVARELFFPLTFFLEDRLIHTIFKNLIEIFFSFF